MAKGSFAVPPVQSPPCDCRRQHFLVLYGEIPEGLNQRNLRDFKPEEEMTIHCAGICSCKKVHNFRILVNPMNSVIIRTFNEI